MRGTLGAPHKKNTALLGFSFALAASLLAVSPALAQSAASSTQTVQLPYTLLSMNSYPGVSSSGQYFDSNLGTLTGVTLSFANYFSDQAYFANDTSFTEGGTYNVRTFDDLYSANSVIGVLFQSSINNKTGYNTAVNATAYDYYNMPAQTGRYYNDSDVGTPVVANFIDAMSLADFSKTGGGTFNINSSSTAYIDFVTTGVPTPSVSFFYETGVGALTIAYTYAPTVAAVPEPASWAMMILGMGAVGFAMRRRNSVTTTARFA